MKINKDTKTILSSLILLAKAKTKEVENIIKVMEEVAKAGGIDNEDFCDEAFHVIYSEHGAEELFERLEVGE